MAKRDNLAGEDKACALWDFALRFYGAPGVQGACLAMQEEGGADVPLLIFLVFAAMRGQPIREEELRRIDGTISPWRRDVVRHLRHARRALRSSPAPEAQNLRETIKAAELEAERQQLAMLSDFLDDAVSPDRSGAGSLDIMSNVRASLAAYAALLPSLDGPHLAGFIERTTEFSRQER